MTRNFRLALIGCSAFAGAALVVEFALPFLFPSSGNLESARAHDEQLAAKRADAMVTEILKRPLFTEGRMPPMPKVAAKPEPPRLQGRLAGVVIQPDDKEALFTRPGGRPLAVREGGVIDGWTVGKIEIDSVTLTSAFGQQVIRPTNGGPEEVNAPAARPVARKSAPKGRPAQQMRIPGQPPVPGQGPAPGQMQMPGQMPGQVQIPGRPPMPLPAKKAALPSTTSLARASSEAGSWPS